MSKIKKLYRDIAQGFFLRLIFGLVLILGGHLSDQLDATKNSFAWIVLIVILLMPLLSNSKYDDKNQKRDE